MPTMTDRPANWRGAENYAITVCSRLRMARLLNGLTLEAASERLGYNGSKTQLSLFETFGESQGASGRAPPLWLIVRASIVYGVPLDYLFGLIGEVEVTRADLERFAISRKVNAQLLVMADRIASHMTRIAAEGTPAVSMTRELCDRADAWVDAFNRFVERNREAFDDMPVGNKMLDIAKSLSDASAATRRALHRHDTFSAKALAAALGERDGTLPLNLHGATA